MTDYNSHLSEFESMLRDYYRWFEATKDKWNDLPFPKVKVIEAEIDKKIDGRGTISSIDLEKLLQKVKDSYAGKQKEEFTHKELRNFPFILLHKENSVALCQYILKQIHLEKILPFRRVLFAYFNDYKIEDSCISFLQNELQQWIKVHPETAKRNQFLVQSPFLLMSDGAKQMGERMLACGIRSALQDIDFPKVLSASRFVKVAILYVFYLKASIKLKYSRLEEFSKNASYKSLIPYAIGPMIIEVEKENASDIKAKLINLVFREMGDPRGKDTRWIHVDPKAREIYRRWMIENDFNIFFWLLEKTAGRTADGERMWRERHSFWKSYIDKIGWTRVVLGDIAKQMVYRENLNLTNYDYLSGKEETSSLLAFVIGEYTFIEATHNGALRIFKNRLSPIDIEAVGHKRINYQDITQAKYEEEKFIHRGRWQSKVAEWIQEHCDT